MKLSAPKKGTWAIAVALGALSLVVQYGVLHLSVLRPHTFLMMAAGWLLLTVATLMKGL